VCQRLSFDDARLQHRNLEQMDAQLKRRVRNFLYLNGENDKSGYQSFYDDATLEAVRTCMAGYRDLWLPLRGSIANVTRHRLPGPSPRAKVPPENLPV
jgi:hypothetical protein